MKKIGVVGLGDDSEEKIIALEQYLKRNSINYVINRAKRLLWLDTLEPELKELFLKEKPKPLIPQKVA